MQTFRDRCICEKMEHVGLDYIPCFPNYTNARGALTLLNDNKAAFENIADVVGKFPLVDDD